MKHVGRAGLGVSGFGLFALLALSSQSNAFDINNQIGPNPKLPEITQYLFPPMHLAKIAGWQKDEKPDVAEGLQIRALATGLAHPRSIYELPNGDILVAESQGPGVEPTTRPKSVIMAFVESMATSSGGQDKEGNRIILLRDANGDGIPETQSVFVDKLNSPFGMVLVGNDFYVANTDSIIRYHYNTGDTQIATPGTPFLALPGGPIDHHWTKSLAASPDGKLLYVGVGSNSNVGENGMEAERDRAAIWQIDRATGAYRVFATGLRNPNGLSFEPKTGALWAVINERDELGPDLVPDYLTSVKDGAFYGWPYSYYGQHIDPRVEPQRPDLVAKAIAPDYALSSHVAPLGLSFNTGENLKSWGEGAFVGEHGSWNRLAFNGYKVIFVPFADGRPNGMPRDVVTGFINGNEEARGRPVGLALDKAGALLIADDAGNTVWRVTAAPQQASKQ